MIRILNIQDMTPDDIFMRRPEDSSAVTDVVAAILAEVRERGDGALRDYTERFDGWRPDALEVTQAEWDAGVSSLDPELLAVLTEARDNIASFHEHQKREGFSFEKPGILLGQKVTPLRRAGVYVPGGKAAYPSSVLMNIVPAKVAGVDEIIMCTPCDPSGKVYASTLVAAKEAGADVIYKCGGTRHGFGHPLDPDRHEMHHRLCL